MNSIANIRKAEQEMRRNAKGMNNYYRWNLEMFPIEKGKKILDLGCGPCAYLEPVLSYSPEMYVATDNSLYYLKEVEMLTRKHSKISTRQLDLLSDEIPESSGSETFDYCFCFDVLEHIQDDERALQNIHRIMIAKKIKLLFLRVPAFPAIYGSNDRAIGHLRRYSDRTLRKLLETCSFSVEKLAYQNMLGIIPWLIMGRIFGRSLAVADREGRFYNMLVPLLRVFESIIPPPIGLSLYCVCRT